MTNSANAPAPRTRRRRLSPEEEIFPVPDFDPVIVRPRHDGWTADKQIAFLQALAECGCVTEACQRVGRTAASAYALRTRADAQSFRYAWDAALDHAIHCLEDAAFSRAIKGVARPVFYQGEQVGERRHYDERLTTFLLRYRDPVRYGAWNDEAIAGTTHPDTPAFLLAQSLLRVLKDGQAFDGGDPRPEHPPWQPSRHADLLELFGAILREDDAQAAAARTGGEAGKADGDGRKLSGAKVTGAKVTGVKLTGMTLTGQS